MLIAAGATGLLQDHGALRDWCHRSTELYAEKPERLFSDLHRKS